MSTLQTALMRFSPRIRTDADLLRTAMESWSTSSSTKTPDGELTNVSFQSLPSPYFEVIRRLLVAPLPAGDKQWKYHAGRDKTCKWCKNVHGFDDYAEKPAKWLRDDKACALLVIISEREQTQTTGNMLAPLCSHSTTLNYYPVQQ
jgi:hypothetical protein